MRRRKPEPEPPCDPSQVVVDDILTALLWPRQTYYNKPVAVTGRVKSKNDRGFTLMCPGGYHTVRICDVLKIKKVTV